MFARIHMSGNHCRHGGIQISGCKCNDSLIRDGMSAHLTPNVARAVFFVLQRIAEQEGIDSLNLYSTYKWACRARKIHIGFDLDRTFGRGFRARARQKEALQGEICTLESYRAHPRRGTNQSCWIFYRKMRSLSSPGRNTRGGLEIAVHLGEDGFQLFEIARPHRSDAAFRQAEARRDFLVTG